MRTSIIKDYNEKERNILIRRFRDTVRLIIILFNSLFAIVLIRLSLALLEIINTILNSLKSILNISKDLNILIQLLYLSFRDFLVDKKRYFNRYF